jgi:O-antigen/teichoic acid export membrane protein
MRTKLTALAGDSLIYGLGQAATKSIYLVLVPVLTRAFSTGEYGLVDVTNLLVTLVYMVALIGLDSAYAYHYYRAEGPEEGAALTSTAIAGRVGFTACAALLLIATSRWWSLLATGDAHNARLVALAALTLPGAAGVAAIQDNMRVTFRPAAYGVFTATNVLANGVGTIALVVGLEVGPAGVFLGRILADGLSTVAGLLAIRRQLVRRISRAALGRMVRFGAPLVAGSLSYWIVAYADRYFLVHARSMNEVGVYTVAAKLGAVVTFFVSAFTLAWGPYCYALAGHPEVRRTMSRVLNLYALGSGLLAAALTIYAREAYSIATPPAYWSGWRVVGLLAFGNAVYGAYYVAGMAVNMAGKSRHLGWTASVGAVIAVGLSAFLVRPYGMVGVALGTLVGYGAAVCTVAMVGQRVYPLPVHWGRLVTFIAATALVAALGVRLPAGTAFAVACKALALAVLAALAFPLRLIKANDVREAVKSVRRFTAQMQGAA